MTSTMSIAIINFRKRVMLFLPLFLLSLVVLSLHMYAVSARSLYETKNNRMHSFVIVVVLSSVFRGVAVVAVDGPAGIAKRLQFRGSS